MTDGRTKDRFQGSGVRKDVIFPFGFGLFGEQALHGSVFRFYPVNPVNPV